MKNSFIILLLTLHLFSCKKTYEVIMPDTSKWDLFNSPLATRLNQTTRQAIEGVYTNSNGGDFFGGLTAIKWSYVTNGTDTTYHMSGFFGRDIAYFICEGKLLNGTILLNGYWRKMVSTETGLMRLNITPANGANLVLSPNPVISTGSVTISGVFGMGQDNPELPVSFIWNRKLYSNPSGFQIMAHRSGGRTSDLLPVSENSVEMILKTPEFGSTGIEIDIRYTKDGVPILYHDNNINLRETQKSGLVGPIENYTYEQLSTFVRLIHGEKIPTLRQALDAVVYKTGLTYVWLDTKYVGSIQQVKNIQKEYMLKAAAAGRNLTILIGLPGKDQLFQFMALPDYTNTPSLCELDLPNVEAINAKVWAPRFTEGTQNDNVATVHAQGRKVFVWTVDVPDFISEFISNGHFDGILSNYPSCVAYYYYVHQ